MLDLSLLGPPAAEWNGRPVAVSTVTARALLAVLATEPGDHERAALARMFWPEQPQQAASANLRQAVARLRRALPDPDAVVVVSRHTLRIGPAVRVDVTRFAELTAECGVHEHAATGGCADCTRRRAQAAALYRGEFCEGLAVRGSRAVEDWLLLSRERLHRHAVALLVDLGAGYAATGDDARAGDAARQALKLEPWCEPAHRQLMSALAARGDAHGALAQYQRCTQVLAAELGVEPAPETVAVAHRIRGGERAPVRARDSTDGVPDGGPLHGRHVEGTWLRGRLGDPRTRALAVVGLGGVGKTALAAAAVRAAAPGFEAVVWRSLLNAPPPETLLRAVLPALARPGPTELPADLDGLLDRLEALLHDRRCLLVLDNLESVLAAGPAAAWRPGQEGYGQLLTRVATGGHASCVLVTSRERPHELARPAGAGDGVRTLTLTGLDGDGGRALLAARGLPTDHADELVAHYSGNPLALTLVARTVHDLFAGDVAAFLATGGPIFDDIRAVLDQQYDRLSPLEQHLLDALAVAREPVSVPELRRRLVPAAAPREFLEGLAALERRSLLEPGDGGFTLQNVIMEFVTDRVVAGTCEAVIEARPEALNRLALLHPAARENVRDTQARLIVGPVADRLVDELGRAGVTAAIGRMLACWRERGPRVPGHVAGNLVNLAVALDLEAGELDASDLCVWQADLRGRRLPGLDLTGADLAGSAFTQTFGVARSVAISPDGLLVAVATDDGDIRLWILPDARFVGALTGHDGRALSVAFSPDGTTLASGGTDARLWDVAGLRQRLRIDTDGIVSAVAFSPDGARLAVATGRYAVSVLDADTGEPQQLLTGQLDQVAGLAFAPDGRTLAAGGLDRVVRVWDLASGAARHVLHGHTDTVTGVGFDPAGRWLASGSVDGTIRVWDLSAGRQQRVLTGHRGSVRAVVVSPDGAMLASGAADHVIQVWDTTTWLPRRTLHGHGSTVCSLAFGPEARLLTSAGFDQTVRAWDPTTGECLRVLRGHTPAQFALAYSPDGTSLAGGGMDGVVRIWECDTGRLTGELRGHGVHVADLAWGRWLVSGGADGYVRWWDAGTGRCIAAVRAHAQDVGALAFDAAGELLASGGEDGTIRLWDGPGRGGGAVLELPEGTLSALALTPDGATVLGATAHGTVHRWDAGQRWDLGQRWDAGSAGARGFSIDGGGLFALAPHPRGPALAVGGQDGTVRIVDPVSGATRATWSGHTQRILTLAHSPDGALLASAGSDATVRIWDTATGRCLHTLRGHRSWIGAVAFSPDGASLASAGADGTIRRWDPVTGTARDVLSTAGPYAGMRIAGISGVSDAQLAELRALGAVDAVGLAAAAGA